MWLAIAIGSADSVSAPDSGPMMTFAWYCWMHLRAISSDCAALDWLLTVSYTHLTLPTTERV